MAVSQKIQSSACLANSILKSERKSDTTCIENSHLVVYGPQLIWKGNIQELRHFTLDVLKLTGKWKSPGGDVKMFTASDERFVFKWQGSKKKKIEIVKDHDDDLLSRLKNNAHEENKANVTRENDDPIEHACFALLCHCPCLHRRIANAKRMKPSSTIIVR